MARSAHFSLSLAFQNAQVFRGAVTLYFNILNLPSNLLLLNLHIQVSSTYLVTGMGNDRPLRGLPDANSAGARDVKSRSDRVHSQPARTVSSRCLPVPIARVS